MVEIYSPVGVDVTLTTTDQRFKLGDTARGEQGQEYIYVQASGAITQYNVVAIDEDFTARTVTSALAGAGHSAGFAQVGFTDNDYGWVALRGRGGLLVRAASSCTADALLYVGTTGLSAGVVDDASLTGRVTLQGVVLVTANASSTTTALEVIATNPIFLNV